MSLLTQPGGDWRERKATVRDALGSVITQLSANPDITKFSLPAVFLHPYSALELGAFRALRHVDTLFRAPQVEDPLERMLVVLSWAMTAVDEEEFNKKPYNPVLGETLTAWVDHAQLGAPNLALHAAVAAPAEKRKPKKEKKNAKHKKAAATAAGKAESDGANANANVGGQYGTTIFKAEQVSHHPPVSAFTMKNDTIGFQFTSNVQFGASFHGNSVGISTKGLSELTLSATNETYVLSKYIPDIAIQNCVLGTKRNYWTGSWEIRCEQSGLLARVKFSEQKRNKGWLGSGGTYVNELAGGVWNLSASTADDEPIYRIEGVAGRKLSVIDPASDKERELLDHQKLKINPIQFLPHNQQPPHETFRVWGSVTPHIVSNDMRRADRAKSKVESLQRKLRKERESRGKSFELIWFAYDEKRDGYMPTAAAFENPHDQQDDDELENSLSHGFGDTESNTASHMTHPDYSEDDL